MHILEITPSKVCGLHTNTHLVDQSSSSLERSLRAALCFSSNRSFSVLAVSVKSQKYDWRSHLRNIRGSWWWSLVCFSFILHVCKSFNVRLVLPVSPFSMALMSGLSRQSVGGSSLSMPGSSSFSVMAKLVKLYIYTGGNITRVTLKINISLQRLNKSYYF